jgi:hypothetical protein
MPVIPLNVGCRLGGRDVHSFVLGRGNFGIVRRVLGLFSNFLRRRLPSYFL